MVIRIESTIVEELKEKGLNVTDLLQTYTNNRKRPKLELEHVLTYEVDEETLKKLQELGIDDGKELIIILQECGVIIND